MIRSVLRIARWEVTAGAGGIDRRAVLLAGIALVALGSIVPVAATAGVAPDTGIYRVGVAPGSPYHAPAAAAPTISVREPDRAALEAGRIDLLVRDDRILVRDTRKGRAAAAALAAAVERHNDRLMDAESDRTAAFPVTVRLRYVERDVGLVVRRADGSGAGGSGESGSDGSADGSGDSAGDPDGGPTPAVDDGAGAGQGPLPSLGGAGALFGETAGTPSEVSPPFPFVSLVLAFAFVVPMNFVIQAYASSVLHERSGRRGELLLATPVGRHAIVAGKTLPYFAAMVAIAAVTAVAIGGGVVSLAAVVPVALLFLSCAFVGALLARSHKELTFVLVTVSVVVTTYVFVPAIFTEIHPIASISPLTMVVRDLEGSAVTPGAFVFSTLPVYLAAGVLFAIGTGMYREEDLFAQRPLPSKVLDALSTPIRGTRSAALMSALSIPFVFLAELLAVAVLFVLPLQVSLPVLLVSVATIEEVAKSLHLYAGFERGRYDRSVRGALAVGAASGVGFFFAEKLAAVAQLVGLFDLDLGRAAFELGAGVGGASGPALAVLLVAPLVLHVATASVSALGARRGRTRYAAALGFAVVVHAAYNLGVVVGLG